MNYKHLNLRISSILKDESKLFNDTTRLHHSRLSILDLNPDFIKIIEKEELVIMLIEVFRLDQNNITWGIHVDGGGSIDDFPKINFIIGNQNSPMIWYKIKDGINKQPRKSPIGTPFSLFEPYEVDEIDRTLIQYPSLVQTAIPHTVQLNGDLPRYAISITVFKNWKLPTFESLIAILQDYVE